MVTIVSLEMLQKLVMMVPPSASDLAVQGSRLFSERTGLAVDVVVKDYEYILYMATAEKKCAKAFV
jgi:hypothetical protein